MILVILVGQNKLGFFYFFIFKPLPYQKYI